MAFRASSKGKFTGQLYQLTSTGRLAVGSYVAINGPFDTFGVVTSSAQKEDKNWLNQIRGVKPRVGERPIAQF